MKKYLVISMTLFAVVAFSGAAFAAVSITSDGTSIGGANYVPSTNVTVSVMASTTAYAAQSKHLSGSKEYGTLSDGSTIVTGTKAVGETVTPVTAVDSLSLSED
jgi:hypothetical protein